MQFCRDDNVVNWTGIHDDTLFSLVFISIDDDLMNVLVTMSVDLFTELRGLTLLCLQDHRIHLLPAAPSVTVRPYPYPQLLKDEIECQCDDRLAQGIIRVSTSPFSSLVLLVKKPDNTWRFYVDYRELNVHTVKDKFPILVVDELLVELADARFFTKLDLHNGFYQVCMRDADIHKTTFRTHHGHHEFLVMPFGLTNKPSSFQALVNAVLKPFIWGFVLVFFDDILVFSSSWFYNMPRLSSKLSALIS